MSTPAAYELGYRAACTGAPRQVPPKFTGVSAYAWLMGYDDAESDNEADQAQMLAGFEGEWLRRPPVQVSTSQMTAANRASR